MGATRKVGAITYRQADQEYFDKRRLRRHAGVWSLWALGVAAVISGDFFGWNFGLAYGFGGLLVATVVITVMYFGLCFSIAEMSPALPHTGGAYSFARSAMGPWGGFSTGVAETIEYVVTPAVVVVGIGAYMGTISEDLFSITLSQPVWWLIFYAIFVGLNFVGVEASFRFTVGICILSLASRAGRSTPTAATGSSTACPASSTPCRSRSGSTSRSRSCRSPRRSRRIPCVTSRAGRSGAW
jgi:ethanolamine permease